MLRLVRVWGCIIIFYVPLAPSGIGKAGINSQEPE